MGICGNNNESDYGVPRGRGCLHAVCLGSLEAYFVSSSKQNVKKIKYEWSENREVTNAESKALAPRMRDVEMRKVEGKAGG